MKIKKYPQENGFVDTFSTLEINRYIIFNLTNCTSELNT